jgi:hypothetical protein
MASRQGAVPQLQLVAQLEVAVRHAYGEQGTGVIAVQVPLMHLLSVTEPLAHAGPAHTVPFARLQPPAPSQLLLLQVARLPVQVLCGSCPLVTLTQVPVELHILQPLHADGEEVQQTPSVQNSVAPPPTHWSSALQLPPCPWRDRHELFEQ